MYRKSSDTQFKLFGIGIKAFALLIASIFIFVLGFQIYSLSQSEEITIKVKDKYIFTDVSGGNNSSSTIHYRIIDENTGEYFECAPITVNPTAGERMYNSFDKDKLYTVEVRGIKSEYNIRIIVNVK